MRRFLIVLVLVCAGAVALLEIPAAGASSMPSVVPINVRIGCNGENVGEFAINAQKASLSKGAGDTARFNLLGDSDVTSVQVQPKEDVRWPFVEDPPSFGRGRDAATGTIAADAAPGDYGYNLVVTCGGTVDVIDPVMEIKP